MIKIVAAPAEGAASTLISKKYLFAHFDSRTLRITSNRLSIGYVNATIDCNDGFKWFAMLLSNHMAEAEAAK